MLGYVVALAIGTVLGAVGIIVLSFLYARHALKNRGSAVGPNSREALAENVVAVLGK